MDQQRWTEESKTWEEVKSKEEGVMEVTSVGSWGLIPL